jgi:hypothetical protein
MPKSNAQHFKVGQEKYHSQFAKFEVHTNQTALRLAETLTTMV